VAIAHRRDLPQTVLDLSSAQLCNPAQRLYLQSGHHNCSQEIELMARNPYYSGPKSDHFDGTAFHNPQGQPPRSFKDLLKWQFGLGNGISRQRWPSGFADDFQPVKPRDRVDDAELVITMVGHATMLVQMDGLNILTDPVWSERASPTSWIGPRRYNAPGIAFDDLPQIDIVLVSHNHYDHLDLATLKRLHRRFKPTIITPLGNDAIIRPAAPDATIVTLDWGGHHEARATIIHAEPAHHWSARGMRDRRMALWAAFVIENSAGKVYHVGDTGFHDGINYRAAAEKHGRFRAAILPIGAYEPRWFMESQHQNPDEAVRGMLLCKADHAIGHHWATFQLTNEAAETPRLHLHEALDRHGVARDRFATILPGQNWVAPGRS
jgi:L-ascorbate metabolism protein UlaG (beta-lactamase superfamily)